nr:zinc ribbon domain-containing protein [Propionibacterium sp.]
MPTYQYRCADCSHDLEVVQKFTDPALTECPECAGTLRKVFSAVGVVFKGPGFYATDNRTKGKTAAAVASGGKDNATPKTDAAPATPTAATPAA